MAELTLVSWEKYAEGGKTKCDIQFSPRSLLVSASRATTLLAQKRLNIAANRTRCAANKSLDCQAPQGGISAIDLAVGPDVLLAEPLKRGKRNSLSRSRRKSHECGLAPIGFRLKGEL
jgi:hypothetical protein